MKGRSKELDFLRGIAILLVVLRHSGLWSVTTQVGWIGVDLFFVLSGYLVSGLLFSEYKKFGFVKPLHFIIRRGFKIYPLFYSAVILHILYFIYSNTSFESSQVFAEVFFFQNYREGLMGISWSLAIEEHFYLLLAVALFFAASKKKLESPFIVPAACIFIAVICLSMRIITWQQVQPFDAYTHFFPTHLRIDSLAFGVLLSWLFNFAKTALLKGVYKYNFLLVIVAPILLLPPFFYEPVSGLMVTIGFTSLYLGFGIILLLMVAYASKIRSIIKKLFLAGPYNAIAWTGVYSYSIYLIHMKAGPILTNMFMHNIYPGISVSLFAILSLLFNILCGYIFSLIIEQPFLRLREKYFPRKVNEAVNFERQPSPHP